MDSIASKIEERIRSWERGRIFFINDFADLGSAEVVRQTLNRLTKAEVILRPGRGVYCYPKEYGKEMKILGLSEKYIEPTVDDIAWAIAERDHSRIAPNIAYAQYQLGLSQQVPMNVVYLTDGSGRRIPMGQRHGILFKHTSDMSLFAYRNRLMQKRITLSFLLLWIVGSILAQNYTCHIEGTTTDPETKELYLIESGADVRTQANVISVPVVDGEFSYDLRKDTIGYYELIPVNQYENGSCRPAYFFSENQKVTITFATKRDKVVVVGTGKETQMMQQCNAEIDAVYNSVFEALNQKTDSIENILKSEIKDMDDEQRRAYVEEFYSENSTNPHSSAYKQMNKESENAFFKMRIATVKWLDEHPCLYGLADMRLSLALRRAHSDPTTPYKLSSYKNTYSKKYKGHPYHESIKNSLSALDLVTGNKYIDYDVCNADGKTVKLSSFYTGKIIYIDLWASWCGPCRKHAKELIPLYEKYKDKGFQVIAIAREQKEENMHKAVKKDGYPWLCLLELNDKNQIWLKNGVSSVGGGGFMIDDEGTILAVYPESEDTEKILRERLGQ